MKRANDTALRVWFDTVSKYVDNWYDSMYYLFFVTWGVVFTDALDLLTGNMLQPHMWVSAKVIYSRYLHSGDSMLHQKVCQKRWTTPLFCFLASFLNYLLLHSIMVLAWFSIAPKKYFDRLTLTVSEIWNLKKFPQTNLKILSGEINQFVTMFPSFLFQSKTAFYKEKNFMKFVPLI